MEVEDVEAMLAYVRADIPSEVNVTRLTVARLPSDWRNIPAPRTLAEIGDSRFHHRETAILAVPSAIIPVEYNYLVNPTHPDFVKFSLESPQVFELDPRLWKMIQAFKTT